jgi:hypothetical protein
VHIIFHTSSIHYHYTFSFLPMPFPTTPAVPPTMDKLNVVVDMLEKKETNPHPRPVLRGFDYLVKPGMLEVAIANLNFHNHDKPDAPCARYETVVAPSDGVETDFKRYGVVLTYVACRNNDTGNTAQTTNNGLGGLDKMTSVERATRHGKTRTGGRRSCTLMAWFFFAATLLTVDMVRAVFAPADRAALKAAVGTCSSHLFVCTGGCLGETTDGSCPIFAASNDATGNPYGVIGDWDVSLVTSMYKSKCNLSPSCGH